MYYLGVDIGGTTIKVGMVTEKGHIIYRSSCPMIKNNENAFIRVITETIQEVLQNTGIKLKDLETVGVGCPGSIDCNKGVVRDAANLSLLNFPLKDKLEEALRVPVLINNDAKCAALAEYYMLDNIPANSFVMITLGTGIGGAIILDGNLYTGYDGIAGEIGHMTVKTDGIRCKCGRKGCWETYASASALIGQAERSAAKHLDSTLNVLKRSNNDKINGEIVFRALEQHDKVAEAVFEKYISYLGEGIINILNIFRPEVVVIGGGLSNGEQLWKPLEKYITENCALMREEKRTNIRRAVLGNDAGIIGAAYLARRTVGGERENSSGSNAV